MGIAAELAAHLENLIVTGQLAPGSKLPPEREFAVSLKVSRSSLREAMSDLERKHLVLRRRGSGTTVAPFAGEELSLHRRLTSIDAGLENATELRNLVEPRIAYFAAVRAVPSNLIQLEQVLQQSDEHLDPRDSLRLDIEFHLLLARAAQNPLLTELCSMTTEWTRETRLLSHSTLVGRRKSIAGHRAIQAAVIGADAGAAESAMAHHLSEVHDLIAEES
jgi:GntR family transcriptional repressor for pyruvate dehydrogenase complex